MVSRQGVASEARRGLRQLLGGFEHSFTLAFGHRGDAVQYIQALQYVLPGWIAGSKDHSLWVRWEHTIAVADDGFEMLTSWPGAV